MAERYVLAEKDYVKGMKYKDIAEKYEVSINTVKSWKKRYGWNRNQGAPSEKVCTQKREVHQKETSMPKAIKVGLLQKEIKMLSPTASFLNFFQKKRWRSWKASMSVHQLI